jgi:hypothetical protein
VAALLSVAGPDTDSPVIVEIRHQGGAYSRTPAAPNAVGGRDAEYLLFSTQVLEPGHEKEAGAAHALLHDTLRPWATGGAFVNFFGVHDATPERVRTAYSPADHARLTALKALYDPANLMRANYNIPPAAAAER